MASRESVRVGESVSAALSVLGVATSIWHDLAMLTVTQKSDRCRVALKELEEVSADAVSIGRPVAQALLACCYTIVTEPYAKARLREALLEVARHPDTPDVIFHRTRLTELVQLSVRSYQ